MRIKPDIASIRKVDTRSQQANVIINTIYSYHRFNDTL